MQNVRTSLSDVFIKQSKEKLCLTNLSGSEHALYASIPVPVPPGLNLEQVTCDLFSGDLGPE